MAVGEPSLMVSESTGSLIVWPLCGYMQYCILHFRWTGSFHLVMLILVISNLLLFFLIFSNFFLIIFSYVSEFYWTFFTF